MIVQSRLTLNSYAIYTFELINSIAIPAGMNTSNFMLPANAKANTQPTLINIPFKVVTLEVGRKEAVGKQHRPRLVKFISPAYCGQPY